MTTRNSTRGYLGLARFDLFGAIGCQAKLQVDACERCGKLPQVSDRGANLSCKLAEAPVSRVRQHPPKCSGSTRLAYMMSALSTTRIRLTVRSRSHVAFNWHWLTVDEIVHLLTVLLCMLMMFKCFNCGTRR